MPSEQLKLLQQSGEFAPGMGEKKNTLTYAPVEVIEEETKAEEVEEYVQPTD